MQNLEKLHHFQSSRIVVILVQMLNNLILQIDVNCEGNDDVVSSWLCNSCKINFKNLDNNDFINDDAIKFNLERPSTFIRYS